MPAGSATVLGDATTRGAPIARRVTTLGLATTVSLATDITVSPATDITVSLATDITAGRVSELVSARSASVCGNPQRSYND